MWLFIVTETIALDYGIHRRRDSVEKSTRLALWGDSRTNPYSFPCVGGETANGIQHYFLEIYRRKMDKIANEKEQNSPW